MYIQRFVQRSDGHLHPYAEDVAAALEAAFSRDIPPRIPTKKKEGGQHRRQSELRRMAALEALGGCSAYAPSRPCIYPYLFIYFSIYSFIHLSVYLSVCLSIHRSIYLSIYLSIFVSIYLCIYLSIYLSVYLSI